MDVTSQEKGDVRKRRVIRSSAPERQKEKLVIINYGTLNYQETAWGKLQYAITLISQLTQWLSLSLEVIWLSKIYFVNSCCYSDINSSTKVLYKVQVNEVKFRWVGLVSSIHLNQWEDSQTPKPELIIITKTLFIATIIAVTTTTISLVIL